MHPMKMPLALSHPPNEFSVMPFWFWNDDLKEAEIIRQMDDFQRHGVDGFVIHPRVGLPRSLGWMSERLLAFYHTAIEAAQRRDMKVFLYDEGMYPSGSASGQVVAANPAFACRCLAKRDLHPGQPPALKPGENLVAVLERANGSRSAVIDRPANSVIRGLHYIDEGLADGKHPAEDEPPAADILNPKAAAMFIQLVYDQFAAHFEPYFGSTILGIFTDEPGVLGRSRERDVHPGTTGILQHVNRILGYDIRPHLAALWYDDEPEAERYRRDYESAIRLRLEETYYQPLSTWCETHQIALTGHPAKGDDIGPLRYFHIPGQDLVWRWVLPDNPSALEGIESTQAKCAASAMIHNRRRRNANECCGAYGHELTWAEMNWLARWTFVRGGNLLFPHAFYYSTRGPRRDERPPDVGPNSPWWNRYPEYALECRRLSWINTDSAHICSLAILGKSDYLPWRAAKICYQSQYDFNYIEARDLIAKASVDAEGIRLADMVYRALIVEHQPAPETLEAMAPLMQAGRVFFTSEDTSPDEMLVWLAERVPRNMIIQPPSPEVRIRQVVKEQQQFVLLFNEARRPLDIQLTFSETLNWTTYDPVSGLTAPLDKKMGVHLEGYALKILAAESHNEMIY